MGLKIITQQERYDVRKLLRMQSLPIYSETVRKLNSGQTAAQVARWAMAQNVGGVAASWGRFSWLDHVRILKKRVDQATFRLVQDDWRSRRAAPRAPEPEAVEKQVEKIVADMTFADVVIPSANKLYSNVEKLCKLIGAEMIVKTAFITQMERVARMVEFEERMNLPMDVVTKAVATMSRTGVELSIIEWRQKAMALKTSPLGRMTAHAL